MAICDEVPGIEVFVKVAGNKATEYDDPDGPQTEPPEHKKPRHRVFKYIESLDDANFSIRVDSRKHRFDAPKHCLVLDIFIDGKQQESVVARDVISERDGVRMKHHGGWRKDLFKFSKIQTVDATERARVEKDAAAAKNLGLIEVRVRKGVNRGNSSHSSSGRRESKGCATNLAEKALKGRAISHGTSFTDGGACDAPNYVSVDDLDGGRPLVTFSFKYRSRESLFMEMIIPRTPTLDPLDAELEGLSQEDLRRLAADQIRRIRGGTAKQEGNPIVKREANEVYDLTEAGDARRAKRLKSEIIDLTGDA